MRKICFYGSVFLATLTPAVAASPLGSWLSEEKNAQIRVVECASLLWGVFSWEKVPSVDSNNPDPAMRNNPMLGTPLLRGLKPNAAGTTWSGKVYNPQDGKLYDVNVSAPDDNTLNMQGCLVYPFCKTVPWSRVADSPGAAGSKMAPPAKATATPPPPPPAKKTAANAPPKAVDFQKDPDAAVCSAIPGAIPATTGGARAAH